MKCISILIYLLLHIATAYCQLSTGNNYRVETNIKTTGITDQAGVDALTPDKRTRTVTYLDGLGRPLQKVIIQGSPELKDIVTPIYFNNFENNTRIYLPYVDLNSNNYGNLKPTAFHDQLSFYSPSNIAPADIVKDISPIAVLRYDDSPVNNLIAKGGPGARYVPTAGHGYYTYPSVIYPSINTPDSLLVHYKIKSDSGAVPSIELWSPWEAYKMIAVDQQGNQSIDVYDIDFNHTQRRKYADTVSLDTHYVYDDFNHLRYIITPTASKPLYGKFAWTVDSVYNVKNELSYYYEYDTRGRVIREKKPGVGLVERVYDAQDRLVYERDGNMLAKGQWHYYAYDYTGKITGTGLWLTTNSRNAMQDKVNAYVYDSIVGNLMISTPDFTPVLPLTGSQYNTYGSSPDPAFVFVPTELTKLQNGNSTTADVATTATKFTDGLLCTDWAQVLDSNITIRSSYYYDDKYRLIQRVSKNMYGGIDIKSIRYDAEGKVLSTYDHYRNPKSTVTPELKILTVRYYDDVGHLTRIDKQLNDSGALKTIVQLRYNSIGQLVCKTLGNNLDSLKYTYNIQGWLKDVNREYLRTGTGNYFGFELAYEDSASVISNTKYLNPLYTGTTAGTIWRSANDNILRKYDYKYDKIDNLLRADFLQQDAGTTTWSKSLVDYTVSGIKYDLNSNLLSLTQRGLSGTSSIIVDSLKYEYNLNSNKIWYVTDRVNNPLSTLGDFKEANTDTQQDFNYDANGNQYLNMNKLTLVQRYNYLDLPDSIYLWGKGYVVYNYDANGNKLQKAVTDYTGTGKYTTIGYLGDLIFQNDTLQSIAHEEGRIRVVVKAGQPVQYIYDYFEKDQLDNVRVILTEQTDTTIYSAGMETANAAREENTFNNIAATRSGRPAGYPAGNGKEKNEFVSLLSGQPDGKKTGPSLVLRVMAGDTVRIGANAFYKSTAGSKNNTLVPLEGLLNQVLQGTITQTGSNSSHTTLLADQPPLIVNNLTPGSYERLKSGNNQSIDPLRPKAYLNYIYFDEHFKMIEDASGVKQVKSVPDQVQELGTDKMVVTKSGYLFVFPSNESTERMYFDNITISLTTGPLLEVAHYYPTGLVMDGISSNALKGTTYPENRKKFNSAELQTREFIDGSGLEWYDLKTVLYDQQIGRYLQPRKSNETFREYLSPFHFKFNKPAGYMFPESNFAPAEDPAKGKNMQTNSVRNVSILPPEE